MICLLVLWYCTRPSNKVHVLTDRFWISGPYLDYVWIHHRRRLWATVWSVPSPGCLTGPGLYEGHGTTQRVCDPGSVQALMCLRVSLVWFCNLGSCVGAGCNGLLIYRWLCSPVIRPAVAYPPRSHVLVVHENSLIVHDIPSKP